MKQNFELLEQLLQRRDFHALRAALTEENPVDIALFLETLTQEQEIIRRQLVSLGMPEELAMQLPYLKQVLSAMSIPCYELVGYEADDLLGTAPDPARPRGRCSP